MEAARLPGNPPRSGPMRRCRRRSAVSSSSPGSTIHRRSSEHSKRPRPRSARCWRRRGDRCSMSGLVCAGMGSPSRSSSLAERQGLPVVTDLLGKSAFPESHRQFVGIYLGVLGDPDVTALVDQSDCVLGIGVALPTWERASGRNASTPKHA